MVKVKSSKGKVLMPCEPVIARLLLKSGKAKVINTNPFVIKLNYEPTTQYIQDLTIGGYNDWRLPNKDELNFIYQNKSSNMLLSDTIYWSSSEYSANNAWVQNMSNGGQGDGEDYGDGRVRAVRSA